MFISSKKGWSLGNECDLEGNMQPEEKYSFLWFVRSWSPTYCRVPHVSRYPRSWKSRGIAHNTHAAREAFWILLALVLCLRSPVSFCAYPLQNTSLSVSGQDELPRISPIPTHILLVLPFLGNKVTAHLRTRVPRLTQLTTTTTVISME